jgi:N-acyl homoserine lactone hydrolase
MKIHAIETGSVRIKTAQVEGRGHGLARRYAVFTDHSWTDWLPTYAWARRPSVSRIVSSGSHLAAYDRIGIYAFSRLQAPRAGA